MVGSGWQAPLLWQEAETRHLGERACLPGFSWLLLEPMLQDPSKVESNVQGASASGSGNITCPGPHPSFHRRAPRQNQGLRRSVDSNTVKERILGVRGGPLG